MLGNEFPCPANRLLFKIITHTEIAQHFKKGKVSRIADRFNIGGTKTLLTRCQAGAGGHCFAQEVGLNLHHTGTGEQERGVAMGYQGGAGDNFVPFALKELQEGRSKVITRHNHTEILV